MKWIECVKWVEWMESLHSLIRKYSFIYLFTESVTFIAILGSSYMLVLTYSPYPPVFILQLLFSKYSFVDMLNWSTT